MMLKEKIKRVDELFGEIFYLIGNEGVEIVSENFSFMNPVKLGRELEQIKNDAGKIRKYFGELYQENLDQWKKLDDIVKKKDLDAFISGDLAMFSIQMQQILDEKKDKHKDSWKSIHLGNLRDLFDDKLTEWRSNRNSMHYSREKRLLLHIANFCYFLHKRLEDLELKENGVE